MIARRLPNRWGPFLFVLLMGIAFPASACMWGVVKDANTGTPIGGATVSYVDSNGQTGITTTDASGIYAFDLARGPVPAAGNVNLGVNAAGYDPLTETRLVQYNDNGGATPNDLSTFWEAQSFSLIRQGGPYPDNPSKGASDATVTIVEFADFQCPYCARFAAQTLPQILSNYGDRVRFVFMNFPLSEIHPSAEKAAEAGECAYAQGAFWQYHDILLQNQGALDVNSLKSYAASLGMDTSRFNECLDSGEMAGAVQADIGAGQQAFEGAGATRIGVPAFFINGRYLSGAQPFESFKQVIDAALAQPGP